MLKKRMRKKKRKRKKKEAKDALNKTEYKVRVITAFRANKENDLDLSVGDEVTVLAKVCILLLFYISISLYQRDVL